MGIFKNLRNKLLKKKYLRRKMQLNERYGLIVYADTDSVKVDPSNAEMGKLKGGVNL